MNEASTSIALSTSTSGSIIFGQAVTFNAVLNVELPGAGVPTGIVTFLDGSTPLVATAAPIAGDSRLRFTAVLSRCMLPRAYTVQLSLQKSPRSGPLFFLVCSLAYAEANRTAHPMRSSVTLPKAVLCVRAQSLEHVHANVVRVHGTCAFLGPDLFDGILFHRLGGGRALSCRHEAGVDRS